MTPGGTDWQAYYDDELGVTWTASGSLLGSGKWQAAVDWAAALTINGVTGWRLPSMDLDGNSVLVDCSTATEPACKDNEFGYHYWQSGITAPVPQTPFNNIVAAGYWSSTTDGGSFAFTFNFDSGNHGAGGIGTDNALAWALHDGDVSVVPEPGSGLLMTLGLAVLSLSRPRHRRSRGP